MIKLTKIIAIGAVRLTAFGNRLAGSSKIMLLGYGSPAQYKRVEPETDMAMALRDIGRVIRALSWWSLRHRLNWSLAVDGEPVGALVLGVPSPALVANWVKANVFVRFFLKTPSLGPMRRAALKQFQDRWE